MFAFLLMFPSLFSNVWILLTSYASGCFEFDKVDFVSLKEWLSKAIPNPA